MSTPPINALEYLDQLPPERQQALRVLRTLILETVPEADESIRYKMPTYDAAGDFLAALASQKRYISLHLNTDVMQAHRDDLKHLNCGKSYVRFRKLDELPLEVIKMMLQETLERNQQ